MGICAQIEAYEREMLTLLDVKYEGLEWCELGNQFTYFEGKPWRPAKDNYLYLGVDHTSIDINGADGALKLNLDYPIPSKLRSRFDVVTNYGTSEHVQNQPMVFVNINDLCRVGGAMIHVLPLAGNWPDHGRYHYSSIFPYSLAAHGGYEVMDVRLIDVEAYTYPRSLIAFTHRKTSGDVPGFTELAGVVDSGDDTYTGDYMALPRRINRKLQRIAKKLGGEQVGY